MPQTPSNRSELSTLSLESARAWAAWLAKHHAASPGVWLRLDRKTAATASLTYPEALHLALAYGWIDGQRRSYDTRSWLIKFTPRGARSGWSRINREKALALIQAGRMKRPGLRAVEQAKRDGRWATAYDPQSRAAIPPDLEAALRKSPKAKAFFATLSSRNRYAILYRLQTVKRPETRARRLRDYIDMLLAGKTFH
jgi:uncharacterized protein YdeI (YjbR/CyaY-like superfamily)